MIKSKIYQPYSVKLISVTPDAEKHMMYCARVSNPKNQDSDNPKLLGYCIKHGHWSIFEQANMTVEIETSRAISAQILRHRSFCFQEFSQRYSQVLEFMKYPARSQDTKNRQNSVDDMSKDDKLWFDIAQDMINQHSMDLYKQALEKGIAKEQARFLLPLSSKTRLYMSGNVRSWIHWINLRTGNGTQKEHADIAKNIQRIFSENFPITAKALDFPDFF